MAPRPGSTEDRKLADLLLRAARTADANADFARGRGWAKSEAEWRRVAERIYVLLDGQWYEAQRLPL